MLSALPPLTAVIVHFRSGGTIVDVCTDLARQDHPSLDVVIVECGDDGSTTPARAALGTTPTIVVDPKANLGYCGGNNLGFAQRPVRGDVLVVNPDVRIADTDAVARLHSLLVATKGLAAIGPVVMTPDGLVEHADSVFDPDRAIAVHTRTGQSAWPSDLSADLHDVPWLNGCCWLLHATALEEIGGFDERFFLYCEEVDWSRRAVGAGWRLGITAQVAVEHARSSSFRETQKGAYYYWRNNYLLFRKHSLSRRWIVAWAGRLLRFAASSEHLRSGAAINALWGGFDALRGRTGPRPGRGMA